MMTSSRTHSACVRAPGVSLPRAAGSLRVAVGRLEALGVQLVQQRLLRRNQLPRRGLQMPKPFLQGGFFASSQSLVLLVVQWCTLLVEPLSACTWHLHQRVHSLGLRHSSPMLLFLPCLLHRDFQENNGETDTERQARLSRFTGAQAISSDAYFNRSDGTAAGPGAGPGGELDLTAAELVNRLSFHVSRLPRVVKHGSLLI